MDVVPHERVLPLSGSLNFRDLGGYETTDGRHVKWRKAFRSGSLANLTPADCASLAEMRIATVCDFRSADERETEPCPIRNLEGLNYCSWEYTLDNMKSRLRGEANSADDMRGAMLDFYAELPWLFARHYRDMFALLAAGNVPLVFNCAAGKDRTGVAAALLLGVLGVADDDIVEDYCLSDKIVDYEKKLVAPRRAKQESAAGFHMARLSPEARAPLLRSDADYIRTALAAVETRSGSVHAFVQSQLGVSEEALGRIRDLLLH